MTKAKVFDTLHYCKRHAVIMKNFELKKCTGDEYNHTSVVLLQPLLDAIEITLPFLFF